MHRGSLDRSRPGNKLARSLALVAGVLAAGCMSDDSLDSASFGLVSGEMLVYKVGHAVPSSELIDLGPPADLGGTVLEGDPAIAARIDHSEGGLMAGVFQATRGKILIDFPFTEHATILWGMVKLTDEHGNTHTFKPGDSYLIRQGSKILWEVKGPMVQKSFFNRVETFSAPGPMVVYRKGEAVSEEELTDLGDPASLGGTVLDGPVAISARVDFYRDGLVGGVFQATRGDVLIRFPFTEHATVSRGKVVLTDEFGTTHVFKPGDSYLIRRGSEILWQVQGPSVQKSFLHFH